MYYKALIRPAIFRLLEEQTGGYRVERELHHHFTLCLNQLTPLGLGHRGRLVRYEEPTTGKYCGHKLVRGTTAGRVDLFFPGKETVFGAEDAALELNFGYHDWIKIYNDFVKLVDPQNRYFEKIYFAYSFKPHLKDAVVDGLDRACQFFKEEEPAFMLPTALHIIVAECARNGTVRTLWETESSEPCLPNELDWTQRFLPVLEETAPVATARVSVEKSVVKETPELYLTQAEARDLYEAEMLKSGIPPDSKTYRAMFEPTKDGRCRLGRTPLWDNEFRARSGDRVLRSEFMDMLQRLIESGQHHQKMGRASWSRGK